MKYSEIIAKKLNILLVKTYEAEHVYRIGAERSEKPQLKRRLKGMEQQRRTFSLELQEEIRAYGHRPAKPVDFQIPAWRNSLVTPGDISHTEHRTLQVYESLLNDPETSFPSPTKRILNNQRKGILASKNSGWPK